MSSIYANYQYQADRPTENYNLLQNGVYAKYIFLTRTHSYSLLPHFWLAKIESFNFIYSIFKQTMHKSKAYEKLIKAISSAT